MDVKQKLSEKLKGLKNKFFGKKGHDTEEDPDAVLESESPNESSFSKGNIGPIAGIKRSWVKGGVIVLSLVFVLAVAFGTGSNDAKKNQQQQTKSDQQVVKGNDTDRAGKSTPNSYEQLRQHDLTKQQQDQKPGQNGQNPQQQQTVQAQRQSSGTTTAQPITSSASLPQIQAQRPQIPSYSSNYVLPSQYEAAQQAAVASNAAAAGGQGAQSKKADSSPGKSVLDSIKAAIAFGIGGSDSGKSTADASGGSTEASAGSSANPVLSNLPNASSGGGGSSVTPVSTTYTPASPNTIVAGTIIPVMMLTGINSDTPGQVLAQVQSDVYDSSGDNLLIPAGSRLIGQYSDSNISNGRVSVSFSGLQTPDGGMWNIGNSMVAMDGAGYAGIVGNVNHHTGQRVGAGLFGSAIAALGSLASGNSNSGTSTYSPGQLASQGALANLINVTGDMFKNAAKVQDTITVDPGYTFSVYVTNNIAF